jgi:CRISPR-associated endonuclease/helicase Cas3
VGKKADLGKAFGEQVLQSWTESDRRLMLVVVNNVDRAREVFDTLEGKLKRDPEKPELKLVHSRFRPAERVVWRSEFLNRGVTLPPNGRIVVATQVVEAGVDLDAQLLVTELAPWPSLVQRFGRVARGGGRGVVRILDPGFAEDRESAPYSVEELEGAREALKRLDDVSPLGLESFEGQLGSEEISKLYPYAPAHLVLRREVEELFDTTPDLTGADLDISRFIRTGEERDVFVAWIPIGKGEIPDPKVHPGREALCAVPFLQARSWLCDGERLRQGKRGWVWDYIDGEWRDLRASAVLPGRTILVASDLVVYVGLIWFDV